MNKFYEKTKWIAVFVIIGSVAYGLLFAAAGLILTNTAIILAGILVFVSLVVWAYDVDILFERIFGVHDER